MGLTFSCHLDDSLQSILRVSSLRVSVCSPLPHTLTLWTSFFFFIFPFKHYLPNLFKCCQLATLKWSALHFLTSRAHSDLQWRWKIAHQASQVLISTYTYSSCECVSGDRTQLCSHSVEEGGLSCSPQHYTALFSIHTAICHVTLHPEAAAERSASQTLPLLPLYGECCADGPHPALSQAQQGRVLSSVSEVMGIKLCVKLYSSQEEVDCVFPAEQPLLKAATLHV